MDYNDPDENLDKELQIPMFECHASNQLKNKGGNFVRDNHNPSAFRPSKNYQSFKIKIF